jgi:uncharacterized membrane protein YccC
VQVVKRIVRLIWGDDVEPELRPLLYVGLAGSLSASAAWSFSGIWAVDKLGADSSTLALALLAGACLAAATGYATGHLSDRIGRRPLIVAGWGIFSAYVLLFALVGERTTLGLVVLAGAGMAGSIGWAATQAFVVDLVPRERHETAFASMRVAWNLGTTLGPVVGGALLALGTLASPVSWTAALMALVVVFAVEFAGVFGGYFGGARVPLLMAVVLAASLPATAAAIPERILGWLLGGGVAGVAAVALWPRYEHDRLRKAAAAGLHALGSLVTAARRNSTNPDARQGAAQALDQLATVYRQTAYRPRGPMRRDRALAQLVTEIERARYFAVAPAGASTENPALEEGDRLAEAVVAVFEASAGVLAGRAEPDLHALEQARIDHRTALDAWAAAQLRAGASDEKVLDGLDYDHRLRVLSYAGLSAGANAMIAAGRRFDPRGLSIPYGTPVDTGLRPALQRARHTLAAQLSWTSPLMHTSVRAALGLALAVLVARVFGLDRAFWVVLGTMSVLRSNALATGRTAVQALAGTLLGFAVGGLFTLFFAHYPVVLWAALPVAVFLVAYVPSTFSFVAGQAAFTVLMLVFFNLLTPVGWRVGLVRIEDLLVGSVIGVMVGTLLWPRGARSDFAHSLSRLYRVIAVHLSESVDLALGRGRPELVDTTRAAVKSAREKVGESFDQLLGERGSKPLPPEVAGLMLAAADHAVMVGDTFEVLFDMGYVASECAEGANRVDTQASALVASWFMLAERIEGLRAVRTVPIDRGELRQAALGCLGGWGGKSRSRGEAAIAVAWTREWLEQIDSLVRELEAPAAEVAASAAARWWR